MTVFITLPPALAGEMEQVAGREGKSVRELLLEALRRYLVQSEIGELQGYGRQRTEELELQENDVERLIHEYRRERHDQQAP